VSLSDAARMLEIAGMNVMLSGDNAVVVGMTLRNMRGAQQRFAAALGIVVAVLLQIAATFTVAELLRLPIVAIAGGLLLFVIAIRLLRENGAVSQSPAPDRSGGGPLRSMTTVIGIYLVMSPDNILAIAAVGRGHPWLLGAGLLLSSIVIIPTSLIVADLMKRFALILTAGAGAVGWIAGSTFAAALPLNSFAESWLARFTIPALAAAAVLTSPLWYRFGKPPTPTLGKDCK
jgi:YjbE family integral membrane protein